MSLIKKIFSSYALLAVFLVALWLRFVNLGYSDFQGDEIRALFIPGEGQSISEFLLTQRKGPIQFVITFAIKLVDPSYSSELLARVPFAIAGLLSLFFFYKLLERVFNKNVAFFASLLFATNGFLIAFSRIVQYQSFVILFMILSLYFLSLVSEKEKLRVKYIYLGMIFWALSLLAHYDGVFIAPFAGYLLLDAFLKHKDSRKKIVLHSIGASLLMFGMLALFYIPFVLAITQNTLNYWQARIDGSAGNKDSSSLYLFRVYQPFFAAEIYGFLSAGGGLFVGLSLLAFKFPAIKKIIDGAISFGKSTNNTSNFLLVSALFAWLVLPLGFMEKFVEIPGTHIYTYLVPLFVLCGIGAFALEMLCTRATKVIFIAVCFYFVTTLVSAHLINQSHQLFVDHYREYPWEEKKVFVWTAMPPSTNYHLSLFGFPYNRNWSGVGEFLRGYPKTKVFGSNEKTLIGLFYTKLEYDPVKAGFYIHVLNPQALTKNLNDKKAEYWISKNEPIYTYSRDNRDLVRIYLMPKGPYEELVQKGY